MLLYAQSLGEYSGLPRTELFDSVKQMASNFWDGLRGVDQQTWLIIGGVLLVLAFVTRRSKRR